MKMQFTLNGKKIQREIEPDLLLIDLVRSLGCHSVKRGCDTANCGLCTVWLDERPVLSCSVLAARADGRRVTTLEGLQREAAEFGAFIADQGAEQCGFCNPGFVMNALALFRENPEPTEAEIQEYLAGNLCRCSGYEGQLRGMRSFLAWKKEKTAGRDAGESRPYQNPADIPDQTLHEKALDRAFHAVNQPVRKKDAMQLLTGQPVYTDDICPEGCLIVKVLRSPHANAMVEDIRTDAARKVPGIEAVYTWEDIPPDSRRFTCAGQTYPEASPYDRLLLDRHVRYVGDPVAIVAGETEKAVDRALSLIKVTYQVLEPVLDFHTAMDAPVLVHPEDNWESLCPVGADNKRNLCAHNESGSGDIDKVLSECDIVLERTYHTKACQQTMMETFRTFCTIDPYGRLHVTSSTQIVFHCRRIVANALGIPQSMVRVTKPRIGGGFGAKQTVVSEIYPAFVTWRTKKPSKMIYTRRECMTAATPRHEMEMRVRLGAMKDGHIRGIDLYTLSNTGAYGEHGPTTVGLSGHKSIPLYGRAEAFRFVSDVVYTNVQSSGAYRGYGATQGIFAIESAVNELSAMLGIDPFDIRQRNMVREGEVMPAYYNEVNGSCALDRCLMKVKEMSGWEEKFPARILPDGRIRAMGMGMAMQGSGISGVDVGSANLKLNDQGHYTLTIGAADMGTGCDTILAQIAAQVLECPVEAVTVFGADTDASPYDSGSYASSTTYVTGKAVEKCAWELRERVCLLGSRLLGCPVEQVGFDGKKVYRLQKEGETKETAVSLSDIAVASMCGHDVTLEATYTHSSPTSPPPYMAGVAEIELDPATGSVKVVDYYAAVDCGTPINPNLARVQAEGGILQGIGMALTENVTYNEKGRVYENSLMQYKIPARTDFGHIHVAFESSYEEAGPFGAKSIGEIVINTPLPSIADAIFQATGKRFYELPIMPRRIVEETVPGPQPRIRQQGRGATPR